MGVTLNNDKLGNDGASGTNPNKPITPQSPNGIAHSTCDITGTDGLVTTVKAERAAMKLDWAAWVASLAPYWEVLLLELPNPSEDCC